MSSRKIVSLLASVAAIAAIGSKRTTGYYEGEWFDTDLLKRRGCPDCKRQDGKHNSRCPKRPR